MKNSRSVSLLAATLMMASGTMVSYAQTGNPPADAMEKPAAAPHSSSAGTAPHGMGSTGWTGGSRGQTEGSATTTGQNSRAQDSEAAKDQPSLATGQDLKGPATQFPANKTPE